MTMNLTASNQFGCGSRLAALEGTLRAGRALHSGRLHLRLLRAGERGAHERTWKLGDVLGNDKGAQ